MKSKQHQEQGGVLITAIILITTVAVVLVAFYQGFVPKYRSIYQAASWQEALHGAEAGVDYTMQVLNNSASTTKNPDAYAWTGFTTTNTNAAATTSGGGSAATPVSNLNNRERTLNAAQLPFLGGTNNVRVMKVSVDVYTRNNTPPNNSSNAYPWFRIRSTGKADVPGRTVPSDSRDTNLRRMKLNNASPYVTRTVEVIARPKFRFSRAITTVTDLSLGNSSNWAVDSFDSTDTAKSEPGNVVSGYSAGGVYPASTPSEIQSNGSIATQAVEPSGVTYGTLITGNGAIVKGDVLTVGGDDPATATHENVSGSGGMDQSRIRDDFDDTLPPVPKPGWSATTSNPPGNTGFATSTSSSSPTRYIISGNLGAFAVTAPAAGSTGYIEIVVNGNLSIGNGNGAKVVIPPNVYASIYVDGNIDFGNGSVNSDSASSQVASHLTVYGVHASGTYTASGNAVETLTFYGPAYAATLSGTVTTVGSFVANTFRINGGGNGGFHYDEALGNGGDIVGWVVASYMDDARTDLQ